MNTYSPTQGCPKCGGTAGYSYTMTECHAMSGIWGGEASSGDSGNRRYSLVLCNDCGAKFQLQNLTNIGAIDGD